MYDRAVTDRAIEARSRQQGWWLTPHTVAETERAIGHFNDLIDPERNTLRRKLTKEEARFIQNERRLCQVDFVYWATRFARIINWKKRPDHFTPNIAQQIQLRIWGEFEAAGRAVHCQNLKARRLGISTLAELAVQHRFQFHPYSNCVVASADPDKSVEMAQIINFSHEHQPWWLLPAVTKVKRGIPAEFGDIHTALTIQAGNQFNGIAQGATPSVVHLSELSQFVDADALVDTGLYRAIIDTPTIFCILESTAEGIGNWWHRTWEQNKKDWDRGRGRVRPIFLPWYVGTDLYPTEADLRARPVPSDWSPSERIANHAERARHYVLRNPLLFEYLAKNHADWRLTREQLWFYEIEYESAHAKKNLNEFLSQMPADDIEAFQSDKISVVDQETIRDYRERTREPEGVYTILGEGIPPQLVVGQRHWDRSKAPITIKTNALLRYDATYTLMPLVWEGFLASPDPSLRLFIWEHPQANTIYGQGVDTSDGIGQDWTVIEMMRRGTIDGYDAQVAEFASPYVKALQLWPMALALACYYSPHQDAQQRRVQCRSAIECKGNGDIVQHEMKKRGWWNFHPWKRLDDRRLRPDSSATKDGVFTNEWFRDSMIDRMLTFIEEQALDVASPYLVNEMAAIARGQASDKIEASGDEHDDRFMALGFILYSLHVNDRDRTTRRGRVLERVEATNDEAKVAATQYATYRPPDQSFDRGNVRLPYERLSRGQGRLGRYVNPNMPVGFR